MSQAIVPQNGGGALAPMSSGLEGVDDFTSADLKIPILKIVHGVSKMERAEKHVGEWWNSITGEFADSLDVVILRASHPRALFLEDSDKPECISRDGINGSAYGPCATCDCNADLHPELWEKGTVVKRCNKGYGLLLALPGDGSMALFTAMKTNVNPIKTLLTQLYFRKLPVFGAVITFGVQPQTDGSKKWYTVAPRIKEILGRDAVQAYREMGSGLVSARLEIVDEEAPPPTEDGGVEWSEPDERGVKTALPF